MCGILPFCYFSFGFFAPSLCGQVFVSSSSNSPVYKIFEMDARLSKFCMFEFCDPDRIQAPDSYVQFSVNERVHRIAIWLEDRFNVAVCPLLTQSSPSFSPNNTTAAASPDVHTYVYLC
jgi:hypothetical protein